MPTQIAFKEIQRLEAMSVFEKELKAKQFDRIAGIDEAGRGPLAGPVVAAACILPDGVLFEGLNDSKQLTAEKREALFEKITGCPSLLFGIGKASVAEIDRYNILQATFLAMKRAVAALVIKPDYILVDGNQLPSFEIQAQAIIEGDKRSVSIAAASILAKVTRDRMMRVLDAKWPAYGFLKHKGYATSQHLEAIQQWGPCPIHRKSFDPVKSFLIDQQASLFG